MLAYSQEDSEEEGDSPQEDGIEAEELLQGGKVVLEIAVKPRRHLDTRR
jgi:hypothetical protein